MKPFRRATQTVAVTLVVYAVLCATHVGEFWPFSIYPMFSQAGHPWTRALAREVPEQTPDSLLWRTVPFERLPGESFALKPNGMFQNDFANYVSKTKVWDRDRIRGIRAMFGEDDLRHRHFLVMKMRGEIVAGDSIAVTAIPILRLTPDTVRFNPDLPTPVRPFQ